MSHEEKVIELLEHVPLFAGLKRRQLRALAKIFIDRRCDAGKVLVPQDRDGYGFFVIVSGTAQAVRERADEGTVVLNAFGYGAMGYYEIVL